MIRFPITCVPSSVVSEPGNLSLRISANCKRPGACPARTNPTALGVRTPTKREMPVNAHAFDDAVWLGEGTDLPLSGDRCPQSHAARDTPLILVQRTSTLVS
jgi:hypothetical protein